MDGSHGFLRRALAALVCVVSVAAGFALVFRSSASEVLPSVSTPQLLGLLALMILPGVVLLAARADRSAQQHASARAAFASNEASPAARIEPADERAEIAAATSSARALVQDARAHAPARPGEDAAERHRRRSRAGTAATRSAT